MVRQRTNVPEGHHIARPRRHFHYYGASSTTRQVSRGCICRYSPPPLTRGRYAQPRADGTAHPSGEGGCHSAARSRGPRCAAPRALPPTHPTPYSEGPTDPPARGRRADRPGSAPPAPHVTSFTVGADDQSHFPGREGVRGWVLPVAHGTSPARMQAASARSERWFSHPCRRGVSGVVASRVEWARPSAASSSVLFSLFLCLSRLAHFPRLRCVRLRADGASDAVMSSRRANKCRLP